MKKTIHDLLQDADPLAHEPEGLAHERERLRHVVVAAISDVPATSTGSLRPWISLLATVAMLIAIVALGSRIGSEGGAALQAAVRFEVRLAEDRPAAGLQEARASGSDRVVYLHPENVVTNDDISQSRVVPGDGPSRFNVIVLFTAAGTQAMRQATASHIGKPVALLIDGEVVAAPVLRAPIGTSAVISGDYTQAEAERIVKGMSLR